MTALRVLVAEDNEQVRRIVCELLSSEFQVVGQVGDGQALLQAAVLLQPDVIVSDIVMPIVDGLSAREELRSMSAHFPFVFMTLMELGQVNPVEEGCLGFVHKKDLYSELKPAVRIVLKGGFYLSRSLSKSEG